MKNIFSKVKEDHIFYILLILYVGLLFSLTFFRDMLNDEALYFHETYLISELFSAGRWVGAYGVGIHGFLFKIPPALIFLITGPSVVVVTIYNIVLTIIAAILCYKLLSFVLKNKTYGILSTALLLSNFHFFISAGTFLREIPSILVILLLLNHIVRRAKDGKFILSILFLLLLDAKEYIFAIYAVFYVLWLFIDSDETHFFRRIWGVMKHSFLIFLPSLIWVVLMFTTHIVPVNMFLASTIGLRDNTFGYLVHHFDIETSTINTLEGGRRMFSIIIQDYWHPVVIFLASLFNTILSYIGKIMYPRVFSFLSVPKVVILPVVASCIITLKRFIFTKGKEAREKIRGQLRTYALLSTLILTWLTIYILRASHGRYLMPIVPAIAVMFVYFLFKLDLSVKQKKAVFISTVAYVSVGIYFETSYVIPKILLEFGALTFFLTVFLKPHLQYVKKLLVVLLVSGSLASALLFSYVQGQIYGYMNFGRNRNAKQIAQLLPEDRRYWINSPRNDNLISVFNEETYLDPEWRWKLHELVPIGESLRVYGEKLSFTFRVRDVEIFKENVENFNIEVVAMIVTGADEESYPDQEFLDYFVLEPWLELEEKVKYKGMDVYIFRVTK